MKKINFNFILLLIFININSVFSQNYYELGYAEFEKNNYQISLELFNKSIQNNKELSKSYMYRGALNLYFGNLKDSKDDLDTSFKLDSINEKIYFYYGKYYLIVNDYEKSVNYYNIAILKNPKYANAYADRSVSEFMSGNIDKSLLDILEAIKIDPNNQKAYSNRGFIKIKLKQFEEAIKDIDISLKIRPNQKDYANKGFACLNLNMFYAAIDNFTYSLEYLNNDPQILYYRGYCYEALGIYEKACEDFIKSNSLENNESSIESMKRINCKQ